MNHAGWLDSPFQSQMKFRERNLLEWMYLQSGNKTLKWSQKVKSPFCLEAGKILKIFFSLIFFSSSPPCDTFRLNTRTIFVTSFWWLRKWTIDCEFFFCTQWRLRAFLFMDSRWQEQRPLTACAPDSWSCFEPKACINKQLCYLNSPQTVQYIVMYVGFVTTLSHSGQPIPCLHTYCPSPRLPPLPGFYWGASSTMVGSLHNTLHLFTLCSCTYRYAIWRHT